jgi:hypothetical protein
MDRRIAEHNANVEHEDDRIECRRQRVGESRRKQKICLTVREWRDERDRAQDRMRNQRPNPCALGCPGESLR